MKKGRFKNAAKNLNIGEALIQGGSAAAGATAAEVAFVKLPKIDVPLGYIGGVALGSFMPVIAKMLGVKSAPVIDAVRAAGLGVASSSGVRFAKDNFADWFTPGTGTGNGSSTGKVGNYYVNTRRADPTLQGTTTPDKVINGTNVEYDY